MLLGHPSVGTSQGREDFLARATVAQPDDGRRGFVQHEHPPGMHDLVLAVDQVPAVGGVRRQDGMRDHLCFALGCGTTATPHGPVPTRTRPVSRPDLVSTTERSFEGPSATNKLCPSGESAAPAGSSPT